MLTFQIYPTTSGFLRIVQQLDFPSEITFCLIFVTKSKVVPLFIFQILIKTHNMIFFVFFEKKTFSILIKRDVVG